MSDVLRDLENALANVSVQHIEPIFKPGVLVTIIVRTPSNNEADVLITSETNLDEIMHLVARSKIRTSVH